MSTMVNAIFSAGGPSAKGSMRAIQLKRGNKVITEIDLYQYAQVQIEFNIIDTSGVGVLSNQYVQEGYLLEGDEWPE